MLVKIVFLRQPKVFFAFTILTFTSASHSPLLEGRKIPQLYFYRFITTHTDTHMHKSDYKKPGATISFSSPRSENAMSCTYSSAIYSSGNFSCHISLIRTLGV